MVSICGEVGESGMQHVVSLVRGAKVVHGACRPLIASNLC